MGGTGCPLDETFFLHCQRRHPELPKIPTYLRLHTTDSTQCILAATLVQAATLGEGVRDFLFDAFLHVARHERPPRATPDSESPLPTGDQVWVPAINWGRHLVRHPEPRQVDTKGRTRYHEPNISHRPPSTSQTDTMA